MTTPAACIIYSTFPSLETAEAAGRAMVEARLAACANILPGMVSIYRWEGALERGEETVLLLKTRREMAEALLAELKAIHPYELPALLVLDVAAGDAGYLGWIAAETAPL